MDTFAGFTKAAARTRELLPRSRPVLESKPVGRKRGRLARSLRSRSAPHRIRFTGNVVGELEDLQSRDQPPHHHAIVEHMSRISTVGVKAVLRSRTETPGHGVSGCLSSPSAV